MWQHRWGVAALFINYCTEADKSINNAKAFIFFFQYCFYLPSAVLLGSVDEKLHLMYC